MSNADEGTVAEVFSRLSSVRFLLRLKAMELLTQDELARLAPPKRLAVISKLWDSLEDNQFPLTAAQKTDLGRRLASLDQDRREGITWAALRTDLEQRCS